LFVSKGSRIVTAISRRKIDVLKREHLDAEEAIMADKMDFEFDGPSKSHIM
jgi:hypothetical protein